jgi:hypothetical protein
VANVPDVKGELFPGIALSAGKILSLIAHLENYYNKDVALVKANLAPFKYG